MISTFDGKHAFMSNFYTVPLEWNGKKWPTLEHAYQAEKTLVEKEKRAIFHAPTPHKAKKLGKKVSMRPDWEEVKIPIMTALVTAKFDQHPALKEKLIATGDEELQEGNWWGDTFWGISPSGSNKGRNELGKILMKLRDKYIKEAL